MTKVEWVIKPGYVERKRLGVKQPGLDLTRAVFDILKDQSFVLTKDCCTYWPTFPVIVVANAFSPTSLEMTNIPIGGLFRTKEATGNDQGVFLKSTASAFILLGSA